MKALGTKGFAVNYDLATIYTALGDKAQACQALDAAFLDRSAFLGVLQLDPAMDTLRAEPCYAAIAHKLYGTP